MIPIFKFILDCYNDSSIESYKHIIWNLENVLDCLNLTSLFIDRVKADKIEKLLLSDSPLANGIGINKCWSLCFEEVADNPELRLALDKLDKESV